MFTSSGRESREASPAFEPHSQGFWIEDNVLSDRECDSLIDAAPLSLQGRSRAGARHLMSIPAIEAAAKDERMLRTARRAFGDGAVPFRATLFDKSVRANWLVVWHQDTALPLESSNDSKEWGPWSMKAGVLYAHAPARALSRVLALRIHLDASTNENGPLRVIPGSHLAGVYTRHQRQSTPSPGACITSNTPTLSTWNLDCGWPSHNGANILTIVPQHPLSA